MTAFAIYLFHGRLLRDIQRKEVMVARRMMMIMKYFCRPNNPAKRKEETRQMNIRNKKEEGRERKRNKIG